MVVSQEPVHSYSVHILNLPLHETLLFTKLTFVTRLTSYRAKVKHRKGHCLTWQVAHSK